MERLKQSCDNDQLSKPSEEIDTFGEGIYDRQFYMLNVWPSQFESGTKSNFYLYELDIAGKQGPWGLKDIEDRPIVIEEGEVFGIEIVTAQNKTSYAVTFGRAPIDGEQAWVGYRGKHRSNQVDSCFDGALFFRIENTIYGGSNEENPKKFTASVSGQLFVEINDGDPNHNNGQITFWLVRHRDS